MDDEFFCEYEDFFDDLEDSTSTQVMIAEFNSDKYINTQRLFAELIVTTDIAKTKFKPYSEPYPYAPTYYYGVEQPIFYNNFALRTDMPPEEEY